MGGGAAGSESSGAESEATAASGNTAADAARAMQGTPRYPGVDNFRNIKLNAGKIVVGGLPGQSAFYTTMRGYMRSGGNAESLWESLQVFKDNLAGYRGKVGIL